MCCLSQPIGNSGGYSYLYLVDDIYNHREPRIYENYSPTIRAKRQGLKVVQNEQK